MLVARKLDAFRPDVAAGFSLRLPAGRPFAPAQAKACGYIGNNCEKRPGLVLLAVLIVLVVLSLIAYNYSDLMTEEYKGSDNFHKAAQVRAFADAGIHYAMAVLSDPDGLANVLGGNPYDNPGVFRAHSVSYGGVTGYFSLVAPLGANNSSASGTCQYGVIDESSKININALMIIDPSGQTLYKMLMLLPNMTDDIANSIIDWVDADSTPQPGGAESDYYQGLDPPYSCKNAPLDSIGELLLVKGVTPQLLYGSDANRNGYQDGNETSVNPPPSGSFDRGWFPYLTVCSREQNLDPTGQPLIDLNDSTTDLATQYSNLQTKLGSDDAAKFIMMMRITGGTPVTGGTSGGSGGQSGGGGSNPQPGMLSSYQGLDLTQDPSKANKKIKSLYDLITNNVQIQTKQIRGSGKNAQTVTITTVYSSPFADATQQETLLPLLFQYCVGSNMKYTTAEVPARVNVNTAPPEVLTALGFADAEVQAIVGMQPQNGSGDTSSDTYQTPAWLITQAKISATTLGTMDKYITTRSQVYRVQSLGYLDATKGPVARIEALIDTNMVSITGGTASYQPRILSWTDMDKFGHVRPPE